MKVALYDNHIFVTDSLASASMVLTARKPVWFLIRCGMIRNAETYLDVICSPIITRLPGNANDMKSLACLEGRNWNDFCGFQVRSMFHIFHYPHVYNIVIYWAHYMVTPTATQACIVWHLGYWKWNISSAASVRPFPMYGQFGLWSQQMCNSVQLQMIWN